MTKINNVEPQKLDAQLLYICPDTDCRMEHWLSNKEVKTPGFMVVCEYCDTVFTPRLVKSISVNFVEEKTPEPPKPKPPEPKQPIKQKIKETFKKETTRDFLREAKETLVHFGFTKQEAEEMIEKEHKKTGSDNPATLVKTALDFLGGK